MSASKAQQLIEHFEALPPEEQARALQDPEVRRLLDLARRDPSLGAPVTDEPVPEPTGPSGLNRAATAVTGAIGGALSGALTGPAGAGIGAAIGAGLGALLPHEKGPLEDPLAYLSDIYLPVATSGASQALTHLLPKVGTGTGLLRRMAAPPVTALRESAAAGGTITADQKLRELLGLSEPRPIDPSVFLIPAAVGGVSGTVSAITARSPAMEANEILKSHGLRQVPELMGSPSIYEGLSSGRPGSRLAEAFEALKAPVEALDARAAGITDEISRLTLKIREAELALKTAKSEAREQLAKDIARWRADRARLADEAAGLKIERLINDYDLRETVRRARQSFDPGLRPTEDIPVIDLDELRTRLERNAITREEAGTLLAAVKSGRALARPGQGLPASRVSPLHEQIDNAVDLNQLDILRDQVVDALAAGEITQPTARALLRRIEQQGTQLVTDAARHKTVEELYESLRAIERLKEEGLESRIRLLENQREQARLSRPGPGPVPAVQAIEREITDLRRQLAQQKRVLDVINTERATVLQKSPLLYDLARKSAGPQDFYRRLLDPNTPDELITDLINTLKQKDQDLAATVRRELVEEYFRDIFRDITQNRPQRVTDSKLFTLVADLIPNRYTSEVHQKLRDFVSLVNEYSFGGGIMPYVTYGLRWTVRALPSLYIIASTATMFPKLAALGATAVTLSIPLLVEQVARRSVVGSQFIRWLREDGADPRRMAMYPALKRWALENGTFMTERELDELKTAQGLTGPSEAPTGPPVFGPSPGVPTGQGPPGPQGQ